MPEEAEIEAVAEAIEPTPEMIKAGLEALCDELGLVPRSTNHFIVEDVFAAMVRAQGEDAGVFASLSDGSALVMPSGLEEALQRKN
jgi:hypothetical protein